MHVIFFICPIDFNCGYSPWLRNNKIKITCFRRTTFSHMMLLEATAVLLTEDVQTQFGVDVANLPRVSSAAAASGSGSGQVTVIGAEDKDKKGKKEGRGCGSRKTHSYISVSLSIKIMKVNFLHLRRKEMPEDMFEAAEWLLPKLLADLSVSKTIPLKLNHMKHQSALCS